MAYVFPCEKSTHGECFGVKGSEWYGLASMDERKECIMSDSYTVTLKKEVLHEFASSIDASYSRYMRKHGIDWEDETNIVAVNDREVVASKNAMVFCDTLDGLMAFENRLKELRDTIEALEEVDECRGRGWRGILKNNLPKPLTTKPGSLQRTNVQ